MFIARKNTPIIILLLVAGFIIFQFDLTHLHPSSIPVFGQQIPKSPSQPTLAATPWSPPELELYPAVVHVEAPTPEQIKSYFSGSPKFSKNTDGVSREFDRRELFSLSSDDRKFWQIVYSPDGSIDGYNTNVIPHPVKPDHWMVIAQRAPSEAKFTWPSVELICVARFGFGALRCVEDATPLPVIRSIIGACAGDLYYLNLGGGPRDARVFYGRSAPYVMYGSQATYTCFSLWMHDLSTISPEFSNNQSAPGSWFRNTMELRRPPPWAQMEKNYFVFWDDQGVLYAHYNTWPKRAFAQLYFDGSAGPDLAPATEEHDQACMARILPATPLPNGQEGIHQATNSLQVTMCKRSDPTCIPTNENTFVLAIYHMTAFYHFHGVYEPFVWLFRRSSPFQLHAISQKPFWIHGRNNLTAETRSWRYRNDVAAIPTGHTEMFYITSINWRNSGQYDHGYIDDVVHIGFGIEDTRSGVLDVMVGDLLQDLSFCDST